MNDKEWSAFLGEQENRARQLIDTGTHLIVNNKKPAEPRSMKAVPSVEVLFSSFCKTHNISEGTPESVFPGNCHAVALELLKFLGTEAKLARGHFLGGGIIQQHSWVEYRQKLIDPTRFQFEGVPAYIYKGRIRDRDYDKFSTFARRDRPLPDRFGELYPTNFPYSVRCRLRDKVANRDWRFWTRDEIFFIANSDPARFGKSVKAILKTINESKFRVAIPIDVILYYGL